MFIEAQRDEIRPRVAAVGAGVHVGYLQKEGLEKGVQWDCQRGSGALHLGGWDDV